MKYTVIATDKAGVEKTLNVEAESREACEKGLTSRGFTALRFVDAAVVPDSFKVTETPAPAKAAAKPATAAAAPSGWFSEFMSFRNFITTTYIKIIWWVGCIVITLTVIAGAISMMPSGRSSGSSEFGRSSGSGSNALEIIGILIGTPIVWALAILFFRMFCEFLIVIFRIYEELRDARRPN